MGLEAPAERGGTAGEEGLLVGEAAEVADGVMGVVGTWDEPSLVAADVEVGLTAEVGLKVRKLIVIRSDKVCRQPLIS